MLEADFLNFKRKSPFVSDVVCSTVLYPPGNSMVILLAEMVAPAIPSPVMGFITRPLMVTFFPNLVQLFIVPNRRKIIISNFICAFILQEKNIQYSIF